MFMSLDWDWSAYPNCGAWASELFVVVTICSSSLGGVRPLATLDWVCSADSRGKAWLSELFVALVIMLAGLASPAGMSLHAMSFVPACEAGPVGRYSGHPCVDIVTVGWCINEEG